MQTSVKWLDDGEQCIGMDVEGSGHSLNQPPKLEQHIYMSSWLSKQQSNIAVSPGATVKICYSFERN